MSFALNEKEIRKITKQVVSELPKQEELDYYSKRASDLFDGKTIWEAVKR